MPNSNYRKGRRNEYRSVRLLEMAGYYCVRAGGSRGIADIWAISASDIILCQVKSGDANITFAEIETMKALPVPTNCRKIIHLWRPNQRLPLVSEL